MKNTKFTLLFGALTATLSLTATASLITWQSSVQMYQGATTETFVNTDGTLAVAYNATTDIVSGDTDVTVNGVAFTASLNDTALVGGTGESITINGGTDNLNAFGDGEFSSNGSIFHLIRGATFSVSSVTLGGLQLGHQYVIQLFNNDARGNRSLNFITGYGDSSGSASPVGFSQLNNSPVNGDAPVLPQTDVGDSILGTFTADAASMTFNVFGSTNGGASFGTNGAAQINAIQLRSLGAVVPEPSGMALIAVGFVVVGLIRRRR